MVKLSGELRRLSFKIKIKNKLTDKSKKSSSKIAVTWVNYFERPDKCNQHCRQMPLTSTSLTLRHHWPLASSTWRKSSSWLSDTPPVRWTLYSSWSDSQSLHILGQLALNTYNWHLFSFIGFWWHVHSRSSHRGVSRWTRRCEPSFGIVWRFESSC